MVKTKDSVLELFEEVTGYLPQLNPTSQSVVIAALHHLPDLSLKEKNEWLEDIVDGFRYLEDDSYEGARPLSAQQNEYLRIIRRTLKQVELLEVRKQPGTGTNQLPASSFQEVRM